MKKSFWKLKKYFPKFTNKIKKLKKLSKTILLIFFSSPALETTPILIQDTPQKLQRPNQLENLSTPLNNLMAPPSPNKVTTVSFSQLLSKEIVEIINEKFQPSDDSNKENSREFLMLKEQLQQQTSQTKQALAQLILVREQLLTETNARIEAQVNSKNFVQKSFHEKSKEEEFICKLLWNFWITFDSSINFFRYHKY